MAIKKQDFSAIKKKYSEEASFKPDRYFDLGDAFLDACGIPGPAMGHLNMLLGHSDTGKTVALIKTAIDAQRKNILPVFLITEQKWTFEHAKLLGFQCEKVVKEDGSFNWDGFFLFNNHFDYVEQITDYITSLLDAQDKGEIDYDLCFLWDSVGSVPCKMTFDGKGGKQATASVLSDKIGMGLNQRITGSRRSDRKYTNTMIMSNQAWVELPDGPFGQPRIMAKGGNAVWLNSTFVFLFGNQKGAGITKISITKDGRKIKIATRTKISVMKNHLTGLGYEDGKILITAHDFMKAKNEAEEKKSIEEYKKIAGEYISEKLGVSISEIINANIIREEDTE
jgi:hypothetical protein